MEHDSETINRFYIVGLVIVVLTVISLNIVNFL